MTATTAAPNRPAIQKEARMTAQTNQTSVEL